MRNWIKLFVPPIVGVLISIIKGIKGYYRLKRLVHILPDSAKGRKISILGNGPSLRDSLENHISEIQMSDVLAVSMFALSDDFIRIRPMAYILVDPAFVSPISSLPSHHQTKVINLADALVEKVCWRLVMYLPVSGFNCDFVQTVQRNKNIHVVFFNNKGYNDKIPHKMKFYLWTKGIIGHLSQTVLNTAVGISIQMGYSEICLYGADTSWHENLEVDQETNILYTKDVHFYGKDRFPLFEDTAQTIPSHLHNELSSISNALSSYWLLEDYARSRGVKIYNCSNYSCIDAFERL